MTAPRLAVVVPTRNRPELCALAVESVDRQRVQGVSVVVSENSGPGVSRTAVVEHAPPGVTVLTPLTELAMSEHWDWALSGAEALIEPTHATFLTDRMVFRDGSLEELIRLAQHYPGEVISYNHDRIDDWDHERVRLHAHTGDGKLYRVDSRSILQLVADGQPYQWPLPRMLNCIVPVEVLAAMRAETGHVFSSVAPDFYFGYRLLAARDSFLCVNHSLVSHHSAQRSNGNSLRTGVESHDFRDFRTRTLVGGWKTAFPEVDTLANAIFSEYEVVRDLTGSDRFPPLDADVLRSVLLKDADLMLDDRAAATVRAQLGESTGAPAGRTIRRRLVAAVRHPRLAIGSRLSYRRVPPRVARMVQPLLPGGVFATMRDALDVARAPARPTIAAFPPPGKVDRLGARSR